MIIRRGTEQGINWYISITYIGVKCAYIEVTNEISFAAFGYDFSTSLNRSHVDARLALHGGCTYINDRLPQSGQETRFIGTPTESHNRHSVKGLTVIGWDYGHGDDFVALLKHGIMYQTIRSDDQIENDINEAISRILSLAS